MLRHLEQNDSLSAYQTLLAYSTDPKEAPQLWELLGRRCFDQDELVVADEILSQLWTCGETSATTGLLLAQTALMQDRPDLAQGYILDTFGPAPTDPQARLVFAKSIIVQAPARALALLGKDATDTADNAILVIDALRALDRLKEAEIQCDSGVKNYPGDVRFQTRKARIAEAIGNWSDAVRLWAEIEAAYSNDDISITLQKIRLYLRLERQEEAFSLAVDFLERSNTLSDKLLLSSYLNYHSLLRSLMEDAFHRLAHNHMAFPDWEKVVSILLDEGWFGILVWFYGKKLPLPQSITTLIESALSPIKIADICAFSFQNAAEIRSPDVFLDTLAMARKPITDKSVPRAKDTKTILIVNATLSAGGAERQLLALCEALLLGGVQGEDINVAFFSLSNDRGHSHFLSELQQLGVVIHDLSKVELDQTWEDTQNISIFHALPTPLRYDAVHLSQFVKTLRPDIIHGWQDRSALAAGWVGLLHSIPKVIMSARNMQPQKRGQMQQYAHPLFEKFCTYPNVVLTANSEAGARDYEEWLDLNPNAVITLRNSVNIEKFEISAKARKAKLPKQITIGGVFRLAANKRPFLWIDTVAALQSKAPYDIHATIIGSGPFEQDVRSYAQKVGLKNFKIISGLSNPNDIYSDFDCLLLMSRVEGLPNVVIEAQACGVPVAACDVGGVREALCHEHSGAGMLLPADIASQDAAAILFDWLPEAAKFDPRKRRKFVEQTFSLTALNSTIRSLYFESEIGGAL